VSGFYLFDLGKAGRLLTSAAFRAVSGAPRNALGAHYGYGFDESFLLPRGSMGRVEVNYALDTRIGLKRKLGKDMTLDAYVDFFNLLSYSFLLGQRAAAVDESYTFDNANPIVGGSYEDLVFLKRSTSDGLETKEPVRRNRNFGNTSARYAPPFARVGLKLSF
jgi:hypothetical protein